MSRQAPWPPPHLYGNLAISLPARITRFTTSGALSGAMAVPSRATRARGPVWQEGRGVEVLRKFGERRARLRAARRAPRRRSARRGWARRRQARRSGAGRARPRSSTDLRLGALARRLLVELRQRALARRLGREHDLVRPPAFAAVRPRDPRPQPAAQRTRRDQARAPQPAGRSAPGAWTSIPRRAFRRRSPAPPRPRARCRAPRPPPDTSATGSCGRSRPAPSGRCSARRCARASAARAAESGGLQLGPGGLIHGSGTIGTVHRTTPHRQLSTANVPSDPLGIHEPHDILAAEEFGIGAARGALAGRPHAAPARRTTRWPPRSSASALPTTAGRATRAATTCRTTCWPPRPSPCRCPTAAAQCRRTRGGAC